MNGLDIHVHHRQSASIKDYHEIDISESKWNFIFEFLLKNAEAVYFRGSRPNYMDDEFDKTVFYLCDEILWDVEDPPIELLFKIKESSFMSNRNLLLKMWNYYEFPILIFSYHKLNQEKLVDMVENKDYPEQIMDSIKGLTMLFPPHSFSDFLWIKSSSDMPDLAFLEDL